MKRVFAILLFVGLAISLIACEQEQINTSNTIAVSSVTTEDAADTVDDIDDIDTDIYATEIIEISTKNTDEPIPIYPPQDIKVDSDDVIKSDFLFQPTKRRVYYQVSDYLLDLCPDETVDEVFEKNKDIYVEPSEMAIVKVIKYANVSREDFVGAINKDVDWSVQWQNDMTHEDYENPNTDIIYTFNSEKINDYYSRDPQKAQEAYDWLQEWLKTNKPYNSYTEYKLANP